MAAALGVHPAERVRRFPRSERMGWVRNPIDAFILARLEREGSRPRPRPSGASCSGASRST